MSYFRNIPNIEYDTKPIQYPFSESEYVVAKNFFSRYQVNPDVFSYAAMLLLQKTEHCTERYGM